MEFVGQKTVLNPVSCEGVGLHSGKGVSMTIHPAGPGVGIVFRRTDVKNADSVIFADWRNVTGTTLGTTISNRAGVEVATIEHLMAALWGADIDNAIIEINGPEVPIMDGSSDQFTFMLECAGLKLQDQPRKVIRILEEIEFCKGDRCASLKPSQKGFIAEFEIDFASAAIARQKCRFDFSEVSFRKEVGRARTFGFAEEVNKLRSMGLARGGSLENAVVVSGNKILNKEGLRYRDEFVRHKVLDSIGDLFLAGARIEGVFHGKRSGHEINNFLLHTLFANEGAWEMAPMASPAQAPRHAEATVDLAA